MTQPERKVMERVYRVVNALSGLGPSNPMDMGGMAQAARAARNAAGPLLFALDNLNHGMLGEAHAELDAAYVALGIEVPDAA